MTKNRINLALAQQSIFDRIKQSPTVILIVFLLSSVSLLASGNEGIPQNNIAKLYAQEQGSTFRGAELLAYSPKKGSLMIKLQVYYSVFENSVPEIEIVSLLASNNKIAREFELQKEIERLDVKPINPESGLMPNPKYDNKIVSYSAIIEIADSMEVLDLIWRLKKDAGLLNNVNLKQNQNLSLHITLDSTNLNPGGNSSFLGLFPYNVVQTNLIDSTNWRVVPYLKLEYDELSTITMEEEIVTLNPLNFNDGYSSSSPASKALTLNSLTRELKLNKLYFGSYVIGLSLKDHLPTNTNSHQAIYIINSQQ